MSYERFENWVDAYREAWVEQDPRAAGALFSDDATYQIAPFEDPFVGREEIESYWADVIQRQHDPQVEMEAVGFDAGQGFGHCYSEFENDDGDTIAIDGVCIVRFDGDEAIGFQQWLHTSER